MLQIIRKQWVKTTLEKSKITFGKNGQRTKIIYWIISKIKIKDGELKKTELMKIAILFQNQPPPKKGGIQKPMKLGGYSDSGADIGYCLKKNGIDIITPNSNPNPLNDYDWVFPDSISGIEEALKKGANVFWLNTVLYKNHPIESFFKENIEVIGQHPALVDVYDDKIVTNKVLSEHNLLIPKNFVIENGQHLDFSERKLQFPIVVKPIRGRGSQGVSIAKNMEELKTKIKHLLGNNNYGNSIYVEQFLAGKEITISVMPPGRYKINQGKVIMNNYWALPPVERFNHKDGIAPYSGVVAVTSNSAVLSNEEIENVKLVMNQCEKAAQLVNAKAPIRIDCRADDKEQYHLFDLNMKPNMTGASRPHRLNQDSLTMIAAREIGWEYFDLLENIMCQKWKPASNNV